MADPFDPVFGDPALRERCMSGLAKGTLVAARHRYVMEKWGQPTLDRLVDSLPGETARRLAQPPLPMGWHPMEYLAAIDRAILEGPMEGDMEQMRRFGYEIASYDLSTLYRMLFRVGTPGFVVGRLPVAYRTYLRDSGTLRVEVQGKTATGTLEGGAAPYYLCSAGMTGWIHAAVVLSGGQAARVEHTACQHLGAPACRWDLSWT